MVYMPELGSKSLMIGEAGAISKRLSLISKIDSLSASIIFIKAESVGIFGNGQGKLPDVLSISDNILVQFEPPLTEYSK